MAELNLQNRERAMFPETPKDYMHLKEYWCMSILSDAQELIAIGLAKEAGEKINAAKRVLTGKYKEVDNGFAIKTL